jgi:polar amino acid transport system permease protein
MNFTRWLATYGPSYLTGLVWTAAIAVLAALCALLWGSTLLLLRIAWGRAGAIPVDAYVQLFRNTPVLLWIYLIYFAFPLVGLTWPAVVCGGLALTLQNGAYICEILRGSFKAIDLVQFDAARSLGLSWWATFRRVVLPQVLVYSIPALGNQIILLLKDTSLLSAISVAELTMNAKLLTEQTGAAYEAFVVVAILYLVMVVVLELGARSARRAVHWRPTRDVL